MRSGTWLGSYQGAGAIRSRRGGRTVPHRVQKTTHTPFLDSQVRVHGVSQAKQKSDMVLVRCRSWSARGSTFFTR